MHASIFPIIAIAALVAAETQHITGHTDWRSANGEIGCQIDTNSVTYWPQNYRSCDSLCVKVKNPATGVELPLLAVGSSTGAWDISWKAYVQLKQGTDITDMKAASGKAYDGGTDMDVTKATMDQCMHLIKYEEDGRKKMPYLSSNSNFRDGCIANEPNSWVAKNNALLDFRDDCCVVGKMQTCNGSGYVTCADGKPSGYAQGPSGVPPVVNFMTDGSEKTCTG